MVEIYWVYRDFRDMMELTENIVTSVIMSVPREARTPVRRYHPELYRAMEEDLDG